MQTQFIYDISVVIPAFNEAESLPELIDKICQVCEHEKLKYEIIIIDDGSNDQTFETVRNISLKNTNIKGIRFRKNFGKSAALSVGFKATTGQLVVTMDADLQDDPAEIPNLIAKLESEGLDLVSGWKKKRMDPISKRWPSKLFNYVTSQMVGLRLHDYNCGFKLYRSEVVKDVEIYGELHRYIPALAHQSGFRVSELPVVHHARKYGHSKFGIARFFRGFFDLATVVFLDRYMRRPLHFFGGWGLLFLLAGFGINLYLTIGWFQGDIAISKRPLLFLGILLMLLGIQMISTGLLGEMITKLFSRSSQYSVKEVLNLPDAIRTH